MRVQTAGITNTGCVRQNNEDSYLVDEALDLYAVADGMGGLDFGEVASSEALRVMRESIEAVVLSGRLSHMSHAELARVLKRAVIAANEHVSADCGDMGTTLTALWLVGGKGIVAHVGDSRLYIKRGASLRQMTDDHTLVGTLVRTGRLTEQEAAEHPMRHILLNAIGSTDDLQIDLDLFSLHEGDTFMLCSDGLNAHVSNTEIGGALPEPKMADSAQWLVDLARARGGLDNITCVLIKVEALGALSQPEHTLDQRAC